MPPPLSAVLLLLTTTFVRVTVSLLPALTPPPTALPGLPLRTVRSLRLKAVTLFATVMAAVSNTRSLAAPSIIVTPAPAPLIVSAALVEQPTLVQVISRSPVLLASSLAPVRVSA
jgi:hypothetical protein